MLHPVYDLAVQRLLNGDVRHCGRGSSPMPMLLTRREPDHVARPDLVDGAAPNLGPSEPRRDDQRLTMDVYATPCGFPAQT